MFEIKKGLKDEKPQRLDEPKVYAGTDTRDAYYAGWNSSYETIAPRDYQRFLDINRGELLNKTKGKGGKILAQSTK